MTGEMLLSPPEHKYRIRPGTRALISRPTFGSAWMRVTGVTAEPPWWWSGASGYHDVESVLTVTGFFEKTVRGRVPEDWAFDDAEGFTTTVFSIRPCQQVDYPISCVRKEEA